VAGAVDAPIATASVSVRAVSARARPKAGAAPPSATTTTTPATETKATAATATTGAAPATISAATADTSPWSSDVGATLLVSLAPDVTVSVGAVLPGGRSWERDTWVRVGIDAGYRAVVGAVLVQTLPVALRAAFGAPLDPSTTLAPFGEGWLSARPAVGPPAAPARRCTPRRASVSACACAARRARW